MFEVNPDQWPHIPFAQNLTESSSLPNYIAYFFAFGIFIAGTIAVISLAYAGIQLILASENPSRRKTAIDRIKGSIIGLIILAGSFIIIDTINPQLETINLPTLRRVGGLQLYKRGAAIWTPAPSSVADINELKKDWAGISWPDSIQDSDSNWSSNCDPKNPNAVYVIYWFRDKNYENFGQMDRMKCGGDYAPFDWAESYIAVKEEPGVYFFDRYGCTLATGDSFTFLPHHLESSEPKWPSNFKVRSMRVVNGPDPLKGPFFGAVLFNGTDYKTAPAAGGVTFLEANPEIPADDNYSECIKVPDAFDPDNWLGNLVLNSVIIYKWAGFNEDKTVASHGGVTLYTKTSWLGGHYTIDASEQGNGNDVRIWEKDLKQTIVHYSNSGVTRDEQKLCEYFDPEKGQGGCLQSFKINGDFLVLITSAKNPTAFAQAFPISPQIVFKYQVTVPQDFSIELGSPELASEYITSSYAYHMIIVPLAEKLNGSAKAPGKNEK